MKRRETWSVILFVLVIIGCVVWLLVSGQTGCSGPRIAGLAGESVLKNGNFEGSFREVDDIGELKVADGWLPWWSERDTRPEYRDAAPHENRIHSGDHAQQWFTTYTKHTAGIYQRIGDAESGRLQFSCWVQCFSSGSDDFTESAGRYRMRVGIDPYGGTDAESEDIVWSGDGHAVQPYDEYERVTVETETRSDRLTVFVWGQAEWALKHNNAWIDDCELVYIGEPTPEPTPESTPGPTPDPTPGQCPSIGEIREMIREELRSIDINIE